MCVASIQPVNISMVSEDDSMHGLPVVSTPLPGSAVQDSTYTHRLMVNHCKQSMCELDSMQVLSVGQGTVTL